MIKAVKKYFPAVNKKWIYLDGPGGTQVCRDAINAQADRLKKGVANFHGDFPLSREMDQLSADCRKICAMFLGAKDDREIHFGPNMTTMSFHLSACISRLWKKGDNIILTKLDHYANVDPFKKAAIAKGVKVKWLNFTEDNIFISEKELLKKLDSRTKFVSLPAALNAIGHIQNIKNIVSIIRHSKALVHIDAVHMAPHALIDVKKMDCDFLSCSAYKFYCPHLGIQYVKKELDQIIEPLKLETAPNAGPMRYETGTQNQASMVAVTAGLQWMASLTEKNKKVSRMKFVHSMNVIKCHEEGLSKCFIAGIVNMPQWKLIGTHDVEQRTPTFALLHRKKNASTCSKILAKYNISSWSGHFYAKDIIRGLGLEKRGGVLRLGFSLYHDLADVKKVLSVLKEM